MKVYVVKDEVSGKYLTSREGERVVMGKMPRLFDCPYKAHVQGERVLDEYNSRLVYAMKEAQRAETEVKKTKRKLARAEKVAAEATTRELVRMAEDAVESMRHSVKYATKTLGAAKRSLKAAEKHTEYWLKVHEIKIP